jgi:hypothetical protein
MKAITSIKIERENESIADLSYLGDYTDDLKPGVIVRAFKKFYEQLTEEEKEEIPSKNREYRGFKPENTGEPIGTENYYTYGLQNYERMESYNNDNWCMISITAIATITVCDVIQKITSGGFYDIESDSDESYLKEIESNELNTLRGILLELGFTVEEIEKVISSKN